MKRPITAFLAILMTLPVVSGPLAMAQTPVATPDPFMLPVNQLILRITEGSGFAYMTAPDGIPTYSNLYIVNDGSIHNDVPQALRPWYTSLGIRDLYLSQYMMHPEDAPAGFGDPGIVVEMRLATFDNGETAAQFVAEYQDLLIRQAEAFPGAPQEIAPIATLPGHEEVITGITGVDLFVDSSAEDAEETWIPFTRFIAQQGTIAASVKVTSLDPAFNDSLARELLAAQLACMDADDYCVPIPLPTNTSFEPGTPDASPVAVTR